MGSGSSRAACFTSEGELSSTEVLSILPMVTQMYTCSCWGAGGAGKAVSPLATWRQDGKHWAKVLVRKERRKVSCANVMCQTWLLPLHNKSLNSSYLLLIPVLCRKSSGTNRHAAIPQVLGDPPQSWEIYLSFLSDSGGGHDEGATALRSGVQNWVQQPQSHLRVCVAQPAKHSFAAAPLLWMCSTWQSHAFIPHHSSNTAMFTAVHLQHLAGESLLCSAPSCTPHCMCYCKPQVYSAYAH